MEQQTEGAEMLDLMVSPVFFVKNGIITKLNEAASRLFLREGDYLSQLLESGAEDYAAFEDGMLYVTLSIYGQNWGSSVTKIGDCDVFTLDQQFDSEELRVLALAARDLRLPLANAMLAAQQIDGEGDRNVSRLNRGLNQLLRIIGNMSDASGCGAPNSREIIHADAFFAELIEKAAALSEKSGITIRYRGLNENVLLSADRQKLERAVLNMISNAMKFCKKHGTIQAELHRTGTLLRFSVTDDGDGIAEGIRGSLFRRYLREPVIEDSRYGIGLGMLMIRNAAAVHGGAVLVDSPCGMGTRITLTLSTELPEEHTLHSPLFCIDYAGEWDHTLLELSECLPPELY